MDGLKPDSTSQEPSNEWLCQYFLTILYFLGNFCIPPLVTEVTISPNELKLQSRSNTQISLVYVDQTVPHIILLHCQIDPS
jgi:hypothetical protein